MGRLGSINPESKRGGTRLVYNQKGAKAAEQHAIKLGVAPSRIARWFRLWGSSETPAISVTAAKRSKKVTEAVDEKPAFIPTREQRTTQIRYVYPTEAKARAAADARAKEVGVDPACYVTVQDGGRWAFVAAHEGAKLGAAPPEGLVPLAKGMVVKEISYRNGQTAKVLDPGPEQTTVRWDHNGREEFVSTIYLRPVVAEKKPVARRRKVSKPGE